VALFVYKKYIYTKLYTSHIPKQHAQKYEREGKNNMLGEVSVYPWQAPRPVLFSGLTEPRLLRACFLLLPARRAPPQGYPNTAGDYFHSTTNPDMGRSSRGKLFSQDSEGWNFRTIFGG
jgi:hypothetical protein